MNGDGFADVIVGSPSAAGPHGTHSGASYVVFGHAGSFAANLDVNALDGSSRFRIHGAISGIGRFGWSVASAGDVNGDGFDDLIVGAPFADPHGTASGARYVVFGHASPPPSPSPLVISPAQKPPSGGFLRIRMC